MTVTPLYAGLLVALYLYLTSRVIGLRRGSRVDMGVGGDQLLERYVRAHANCAEYAFPGLLLLLLLELGGWPAWVLQPLGLMLLLGRLAHAWSFSVAELRLRSRTLGMMLSITMLALAAALCLVQGLGLA